jgi:acetate---CoA ligase (ADP-forming)
VNVLIGRYHHDRTDAMSNLSAIDKVQALLNPRNVVVVGASDKAGNWSGRVWDNLRRYGFAGALYPYNPNRDRVWDTRCYRSFAELPESPDHLVVLVPPAHVVSALREAAAAGARSATIITSGFSESSSPESQALAEELQAVIAETGLAVSGPNCLGNFNARARLCSMADNRQLSTRAGSVAIISQSGAIALAIRRGLQERGLDPTLLVTSGNEASLTAGDYIAYCAGAREVKVVVCYLEAIRNTPNFLAALRLCRAADKPVIVVKLGASVEGRAAAAAHTGALTGSMEAFDAVAGAAGALRVDSVGDMIEAVEFMVRAPRPVGAGLFGITYSGGMRGLISDAVAQNKLKFSVLSAHSRQALSNLLVAGAPINNPLDGGQQATGGVANFLRCVDVLLNDPDCHVLLLQEELPQEPDTGRREKVLRAVNEMALRVGKPVVFVSIASYGLNDYARAIHDELQALVFLQEPDRAVRTLRAALDYFAPRVTPFAPRSSNAAGRSILADLLSRPGPATLDEVSSKRLLSAYGIVGPREAVALSAEEAVAAAERIGYPVAAKIISADLPHKSEVGGVQLNLQNAAEVSCAFRKMTEAIAKHPDKPQVAGVLIAAMAGPGLELILGVSRDVEMGPVLLVGSGGVDAELLKDVALAPPQLDEAGANAMIERTRAAEKIKGYRGGPALHRKSLVQALLGLANLVHDGGDAIESIDVNPFLLTQSGGIALDALVVLRRADPDPAGDQRNERHTKS